jgi:hypothetical protein
MTKNIVLQRSVEVRCWHVVGQVARANRRRELMPVLLRTRERGSTSVEDVAAHLLFEPRSRLIVAQRLLQIAKRYGLLEPKELGFQLTEAGLAAVESEQVFVPEQGTWTIWTSTDPLLASPVLRIDPWREPTAYEDVRMNEEERKSVKIARELRESIGRVATPWASKGTPLRIDQLDERAEAAEPGASLHVSWNVNEGSVRLKGVLAGSPVDTVLDAPGIDATEVWHDLLASEGLWDCWDDAAQALRVHFREASDRERDAMRRDLRVQDPAISGLGRFDTLVVRDVALRASSAQDAADWAAWRLNARVREYATAERFSDWCADAVAPFSDFVPRLPTRRELADGAWRSRAERPAPVAWHLVAAEDWNL